MASRRIPTKTRASSSRKIRIRRPTMKAIGNSPMENHARMVVDPCNAPLTETIYPNSSGVLRYRAKRLFGSSHAPASTAGAYARFIAWHPVLGAYVLGGGSENVYPLVDSATTFNRMDSLSRYAYTGLDATFSARAVAGCISMAWNGRELDRKGMIYSGVVSGGLIYTYLSTSAGGANATITANALIGMLSVTCRVPNDKCEITWVPTEWDSNWTDPLVEPLSATSAPVQEVFNKTNFAIIGWVGAQAVNESVGFVETTVSIIEENPTSTLYVQDSAHINSMGITGGITKIVSALQKKDTAWYVNTFKKVGSFTMSAFRAYARGGALGLVSEIAGLNLAPRKNISS